VDFSENDFTDLESFSLYWRWNDPNYDQFAPADLAQIKPLTTEAANSAFAEIEDIKHFQLHSKVDAPAESEDVSKWLDSVIPSCETIFLFWGTWDIAVVLPRNFFVPHWDAFCYPSSDDLVISSKELSFKLFYHHYEEFVFYK